MISDMEIIKLYISYCVTRYIVININVLITMFLQLYGKLVTAIKIITRTKRVLPYQF